VTEHPDRLPEPAAQNAAPPFDVLRRLRKHFNGRVSTTNLMDIEGPLIRVLRAKYRDHRIEVWANEVFFLLQVSGAYEPIGGLRVMPGVPQPGGQEAVRLLRTSAKSYAIYSFVGPLDALMENFLETDALARLLESIAIAERENLVIYSNEIRVRLLAPSFNRAVDSIDAILDLLPESGIAQKRNYSDLPREFEPLMPLLPVWDLSDDEDRWQKVKRSSKATRKKLIETVDPFMAKISAYLDSFNGREMSDSASALDSLAQAAMEAGVSLKPQA